MDVLGRCIRSAWIWVKTEQTMPPSTIWQRNSFFYQKQSYLLEILNQLCRESFQIIISIYISSCRMDIFLNFPVFPLPDDNKYPSNLISRRIFAQICEPFDLFIRKKRSKRYIKKNVHCFPFVTIIFEMLKNNR